MNTIIRNVNLELEVICCPKCAAHYAILKSYVDEARRLGDFKKCWTCPYCKVERGYGKGEAALFQDQLAAAQREIERQKQQVQIVGQKRVEALKEAEHFRKSRDGMKGQLVRTKKRIHGGACPCCNRFFLQLSRHMKSKHPGYGDPQ